MNTQEECTWPIHRFAMAMLRRRLYEAQDGKCGICRCHMKRNFNSPKLTFDRVWPRAWAAVRGDTVFLGNLLLTHTKCDGEKGDRDIRDVTPIELSKFDQCHFFAGIGLWSVAARAAGIADDRPFWSASCPCQPFSTAGARGGTDDDRHLWPHFFWLAYQCRPAAVVGEQVATKDGLGWLDLVCADMEGSNYAGGAFDLCSAGIGAPNIRQRLYMLWLDACRLGDASSSGSQGRAQRGEDRPDESRGARDAGLAGSGEPSGMVDGEREGLERQRGHVDDEARRQQGPSGSVAETGDARRLGDADRAGQENRELQSSGEFGGSGGDTGRSSQGDPRQRSEIHHSVRAITSGFWRDTDWLLCRDPDGPRLRPVRRGSFCLAAGYSGRAGELRAYGDAINLEVATAFLEAVKPDLERVWR